MTEDHPFRAKPVNDERVTVYDPEHEASVETNGGQLSISLPLISIDSIFCTMNMNVKNPLRLGLLLCGDGGLECHPGSEFEIDIHKLILAELQDEDDPAEWYRVADYLEALSAEIARRIAERQGAKSNG